jgi:hypothetical protein
MEKRSPASQTEESSSSLNQPRRRGRGLILQGVILLSGAVVTVFVAMGDRILWPLPIILGTAGLVALLLGLTRRYPVPEK